MDSLAKLSHMQEEKESTENDLISGLDDFVTDLQEEPE